MKGPRAWVQVSLTCKQRGRNRGEGDLLAAEPVGVGHRAEKTGLPRLDRGVHTATAPVKRGEQSVKRAREPVRGQVREVPESATAAVKLPGQREVARKASVFSRLRAHHGRHGMKKEKPHWTRHVLRVVRR